METLFLGRKAGEVFQYFGHLCRHSYPERGNWLTQYHRLGLSLVFQMSRTVGLGHSADRGYPRKS